MNVVLHRYSLRKYAFGSNYSCHIYQESLKSHAENILSLGYNEFIIKVRFRLLISVLLISFVITQTPESKTITINGILNKQYKLH